MAPVAYAYTDYHFYPNEHVDTDRDTDGYTHPNVSYVDTFSDGDADRYSNRCSDSNTYGYANGYPDLDRDPNSDDIPYAICPVADVSL